jgi:hypothetical protein
MKGDPEVSGVRGERGKVKRGSRSLGSERGKGKGKSERGKMKEEK